MRLLPFVHLERAHSSTASAVFRPRAAIERCSAAEPAAWGNRSLADLIAPTALAIATDHLVLDGQFVRILALAAGVLLGVAVVRPKVLETTALGAAYLAGIAVGYWRDDAEVAANWQIDRRFEPKMSRDQASTLMAGWNKAVERAKHWA